MQSVKLNLIPGAVLPVVNVSQYDVKRTFQLAVYDGAASYDLTGKTVTIRGTKPDNHGFDYGTSDGVVSVSGNTVTISTTQQMTAVGGQVMAELRIESGTTVIGTLNFIIDVEPSALSDDTIISDTEIPVIERSAWEQVEQAEKWATGAHDGTPVGPSEPQFENSAKWWAQHASTLGGLTDVDIESPTNDQVLKYDSETQKWKNSNGGGGASALDDLTDVDITTPASGDGLLFDGAKWVNGAVATPTQLAAKLDVTAQQVYGAWNLFNTTAVSQTVTGIPFIVNADKTLSVNGTYTATGNTRFAIGTVTLEPGVYYLSGGANADFYLNLQNLSINNTGNGDTEFIVASKITDTLRIVQNGTHVATNLTFKPMIALQSGMPYVPWVMTNRELTNAVQTVEDITDKFTVAAGSGASINSNWSQVVRCGKVVYGTLRLTLPSTVSENLQIINIADGYRPKIPASGMLALSNLIECWNGVVNGVISATGTGMALNSNTWVASAPVFARFTYIIK